MSKPITPEKMVPDLAETQAAVEKATDAVAAGVEEGMTAAREGAERLMEQVEDLAERAPTLRLVLDRAAPAMQELVRAESDLASFWLESARDHTRLAFETMQRLASTRDWKSALTIQAEYLRESMVLFQEGMLQQMRVTSAMTTSLMSPRGEQLKDAA